MGKIKYTSSQKIELFKTVLHELGDGLKPTELVVLIKIFDRTILWGKHSELITVEQLVNGIYKNGSVISSGLDCSKSLVYRILRKLEKLNLIISDKNAANFTNFSINFNKERKTKMYNKQEKQTKPTIDVLSNRKKIADTSSQIEQTLYSICTDPLVKLNRPSSQIEQRINNININIENKNIKNKIANEKNFIRNLEKNPVEKIKEIKQKEISKFKNQEKPLTAKDLEIFWVLETKKIFPEYLSKPHGVRDLAISKKLLQNLSKLFPENNIKLKFLTWVIMNWEITSEKQLNFLNEKSIYPSIPLLLRFLDIFINAYTNKNAQKLNRDLTRQEKIKNELIRKGYTAQDINDITEEIDELDKKLREKKALEKEIQELEKRKNKAKAINKSVTTTKKLKAMDFLHELETEELI